MELIKFERNGCIPCKKMDMILQKLNVKVTHYNVESEDVKYLVDRYNITSVPVLLKVKDGNSDLLYGVNHTIGEFKNFLEIE